MFYWLPTVCLLLHVTEEFSRFPAWATRHFGVTTRAWYVYSHIVIAAVFCAVSFLAASEISAFWIASAFTLQWVLATNAFFHIVAVIRFREYSPGIFTALLVTLPVTYYMASHAVSAELLTFSQFTITIASSLILGGLVIASLWKDVRLSWRFWRDE